MLYNNKQLESVFKFYCHSMEKNFCEVIFEIFFSLFLNSLD